MNLPEENVTRYGEVGEEKNSEDIFIGDDEETEDEP